MNYPFQPSTISPPEKTTICTDSQWTAFKPEPKQPKGSDPKHSENYGGKENELPLHPSSTPKNKLYKIMQ